jgi:hypothetical protein
VDPQLQPDAKPVTLLGDMALLSAGGLYQRLGESFGFLCLILVMLLGALSRQRAGAPLRLELLVVARWCCMPSVVVGGLLAQVASRRSMPCCSTAATTHCQRRWLLRQAGNSC